MTDPNAWDLGAHWVPTAGTGFVEWPTVTSTTAQPFTWTTSASVSHMATGWKCTDCGTVFAPWIPEHDCPASAAADPPAAMLYKADAARCGCLPGQVCSHRGCERCAGRSVTGPDDPDEPAVAPEGDL
jgi:hypothetical protein